MEVTANSETFSFITQIPCKSSNFRWPMRRKRLGRRRKTPTVCLGGDSKKPRRGLIIVKLLRRIRLKWLKLQYTCMLRKLKDTYYAVLKDLIEAGSTFESIQQRIMNESYFSAVPIMAVPSAGITSFIGPNRARSKT
ncbi:uncharacterized protein LOC113328429 [Papaver somniferum]|uniref:uncharacterized protein LOC113328429 n=1 Tax=Papaver somniferum TaxID=3469 RepID=UPI000E6FE606|nr:uncharacterized protein LOC113328429 [Papaver somniferum]